MSMNLNQLKWRSIRRSMLEVDMYLSRYIESGALEKLTEDQVESYSRLLEMPDSEILLLLQGKELAENPMLQHIINEISSGNQISS